MIERMSSEQPETSRDFHEAVLVRRGERRGQAKSGDKPLVGTKHVLLRNPQSMTDEQASFLERVKSRALKEHAMCLWRYVSRGWARRSWKARISWAMRSRLEPIKAVARMVKRHLEGIINAIVMRVTSAGAESINSRIPKVKRMANGYRNRERSRNVIYFHVAGLALHP
jgi:transposase